MELNLQDIRLQDLNPKIYLGKILPPSKPVGYQKTYIDLIPPTKNWRKI
jgi:hypothetical protein